MVFQSYALYPTMTVRQNITFGMESRRVPKPSRTPPWRASRPAADRASCSTASPGQLSGGQRQRVAMGRALVRDPMLFLFDEPLSNLDAKLRVEMRTEIKKLHTALGKTTVYVTHDQVEAMTLASRIAVMHQGALQQFDEPQVIYDRPANIFVAGFMGSPSMNFIPAETVAGDTGPMVSLSHGKTRALLPLPRRHGRPRRTGRQGRARRAARASHPLRCRPAAEGRPRPHRRAGRGGRADRRRDHRHRCGSAIARWSAASSPTRRRGMGETVTLARRHGARPACSTPTPNA